jgi:hypothetical protein
MSWGWRRVVGAIFVMSSVPGFFIIGRALNVGSGVWAAGISLVVYLCFGILLFTKSLALHRIAAVALMGLSVVALGDFFSLTPWASAGHHCGAS